jgi:hypothetical protein
MKRWLSFFMALFCLGAVARSEEVWEGNAGQIRRGEFETEGFYAASNSFAKDTVVEVENIRSGKSVEVTVVKRNEDNPNIFLLLSSQAADELGIEKGDVERVRVKIAQDYGSDVYSRQEELVESPDPDVNPYAGVPEIAERAFEEEETEEVPPADELPEERPDEVLAAERGARDPQKILFISPKEGEKSVSPDVVTPEEELVLGEEPPQIEPETMDEEPDRPIATLEPPKAEGAALIVAQQSDPEPPEYVERVEPGAPEATTDPPRVAYSPVITFQQSDPGLPEKELAGPEGTVEPPEAMIAGAPDFEPGDPSPPEETREVAETTLDPPEPEKEISMAYGAQDPTPPQEAEIKERGPSVSPEPPESEEGVEVAIGQEDPFPPDVTEETTEVTEEVVTSVEPEEKKFFERASDIKLELTGDPATGRVYFVQLGAFNEKALAQSVEAVYSKNYPIGVYSSRNGKKGMYRVLVGPLNKDESGVVLHWFKAKGFKDAFVRSAR